MHHSKAATSTIPYHRNPTQATLEKPNPPSLTRLQRSWEAHHSECRRAVKDPTHRGLRGAEVDEWDRRFRYDHPYPDTRAAHANSSLADLREWDERYGPALEKYNAAMAVWERKWWGASA